MLLLLSLKIFQLDILKQIEKEKKVLPKPDINKIIQNRKLEKSFVNDLRYSNNRMGFYRKSR